MSLLTTCAAGPRLDSCQVDVWVLTEHSRAYLRGVEENIIPLQKDASLAFGQELGLLVARPAAAVTAWDQMSRP